jgi:hypothetical protein
LEDHIAQVRVVLERLLANHLFVKAEKYQFHQEAVSFLDDQISPQGVKMDVKKVDAVRLWPVPTTINGLQRRFLRSFSSIAAPLSSRVLPVGWCGVPVYYPPVFFSSIAAPLSSRVVPVGWCGDPVYYPPVLATIITSTCASS